MSPQLFCVLTLAALLVGVVLIVRDGRHFTNGNAERWRELRELEEKRRAIKKDLGL